MPESHVLEGGDKIRPHETGEAANLLTGDGIAFVGHGGTAALLAAKRLFRFSDFGALKMANLKRDFLKRRSDEREGAEIMRVAVALNHLRGDGRDIEAKALADSLFHFRAEVRGVADGARNFSNGHLRGGVAETLLIARVFCEPVGDFQTEGDGLSVNAVGAADLRCMAKFLSAFGEHVAEFNERSFDEP
jgi:hypothetical protein